MIGENSCLRCQISFIIITVTSVAFRTVTEISVTIVIKSIIIIIIVVIGDIIFVVIVVVIVVKIP